MCTENMTKNYPTCQNFKPFRILGTFWTLFTRGFALVETDV